MVTRSKILCYSQADMILALKAVESGMPVSTAAKKYKVPRTTLLYKHTGKYPVARRMGPKTVLTENEESLLIKWIFHSSDAGFPVTKCQLLDSVHMLLKTLKRTNPFKDNRPGRHWYESFLRRHPEVSARISQTLSGSRAAITEENLRGWFDEVTNYLLNNNFYEVFNDPKRIFNMDETAFFLNPKGDKVLVKKGTKALYNFVNNDEKECLTVLLGGNAIGMQTPPMVVFAYERIPQAVANRMPSDWGIGKTENGWMTSESFFEYMANVFFPWILKNNIPLPVIMFVDGHTSHLTMALSDFCTNHQIILIALYPNSTHICQPMDVSVFRPLKNGWKKGVQKWRLENDGRKLKRENFGPLLKKVIEDTLTDEMFINGFRTCGLFPQDPNINYAKLLKKGVTNFSDNQQTDEIISNCPNVVQIQLESFIGLEKLELFRVCGDQWNGDIRDTSLFNFWKKISSNREDLNLNTEDEIDGGEFLNHLLDNNNGSVIFELEENGYSLPDDNNETIIQDLKQIIPNEPDNLISVDTRKTSEIDLRHDFNLKSETETKTETKTENNIKTNTGNKANNNTSFVSNLRNEAEEKNIILNMDCSSINEDVHMNDYVNNVEENISNRSNDDETNNNNQKVVIHQNILIQKSVIEEHDNGRASQGASTSRTAEEINSKSPEKTMTLSTHIPLDVPSPFKRALFWPNPSKTTKKRKKEKIPSVATSQAWKEYYVKKECEKQKKEKEKEDRKLKREEKKKQPEKKGKRLKKIAPDNVATTDPISDTDVDETSTGSESNKIIDKEAIKINTYVIVIYEDNYYPGIVKDVNTDGVYVSVMIRTKYNNWKWPKPEDKIWYNMDEVVDIIDVPIPCNKRGVYTVKEMCNSRYQTE